MTNKNPDLTNEANCLCLNLRMAMRSITKIYDDAFRPLNIRTTQFSILAYLHYRQVITITVLANELAMDRTTLTRNLKPLLRDKLITIRTGSDPRSKEISLTAKGTAVFKQASPLWAKAQAALVKQIGIDISKNILLDLNRIRQLTGQSG